MSYIVRILSTKSGHQLPIRLVGVEMAVAQVPGISASAEEKAVFEIIDRDEENGHALLHWEEGELWARNPTENTIMTMIALAEKLGARVRGDEFESYRTPRDTYVHPDDRKAFSARIVEAKNLVGATRKRQLLVNALIIGGFVLLGSLVAVLSRK